MATGIIESSVKCPECQGDIPFSVFIEDDSKTRVLENGVLAVSLKIDQGPLTDHLKFHKDLSDVSDN